MRAGGWACLQWKGERNYFVSIAEYIENDVIPVSLQTGRFDAPHAKVGGLKIFLSEVTVEGQSVAIRDRTTKNTGHSNDRPYTQRSIEKWHRTL